MEFILLKNTLLIILGHIYTTSGVFQFDNGIFNLKYYLNNNFNELKETNGVFGYDTDNLLKIQFTNGTIWKLSVNGSQLSYSNRISSMYPTKDDVILNRANNSDSISDALNNIKQEIATEELYYNENIRWSMSKEEIDNIVGTKTSTMSSKNITYATNTHSIYNNPYNIDETVYVLDKNQLKAYWHEVKKDNCTYDKYKQISDLLKAKYGSPSTENFNWIDQTYKDVPKKWNDAFRYSDFTIKTIWNNNSDFNIVIDWKYDGSCVISYCEKGYENQL